LQTEPEHFSVIVFHRIYVKYCSDPNNEINMKLELKCLCEINNPSEAKLKDGTGGHRQVWAGHTHVTGST